MELSLYLAKLIGLYLIVVALILVVRGESFKRTIEDYYENSGLVLLGGLMSLIMGLAIIVGHNVWEPSWRVVITIFGYLAALKGVVLIGWPEHMKKRAKLYLGSSFMKVWPLIALLFGGWLTWVGYTGS